MTVVLVNILRYIRRTFKKKYDLFSVRIKNPTCYIDFNTFWNIQNISMVQLGKRVDISSFTVIHVTNFSKEYNNSFLSIGDSTYIGEGNNIRATGGKISIGSHCMISQNVTIVASNHSMAVNSELPMKDQEWVSENNFVIIEDDVWIGAGAVILPGVHIHSGAVIGAGSVVTKDIEAFSVNIGMPTKIIRYRK